MHELDGFLKHYGIKGMRWGVIRNRNRPGGADGKEESTKVVDKRGKIQKNLDSMKRERQWRQVVKNVDKLSTKDINAVTKRLTLENNLKTLSKTKGVGTKKDREDYLRREHMSDAELQRKVTRLRAKDGLHKQINNATKEQREFGEKVVQIGGSLGMKYAVKRKLEPADIFNAFKTPKDTYGKNKDELVKEVGKSSKVKGDILNTVLTKAVKETKQ